MRGRAYSSADAASKAKGNVPANFHRAKTAGPSREQWILDSLANLERHIMTISTTEHDPLRAHEAFRGLRGHSMNLSPSHTRTSHVSSPPGMCPTSSRRASNLSMKASDSDEQGEGVACPPTQPDEAAIAVFTDTTDHPSYMFHEKTGVDSEISSAEAPNQEGHKSHGDGDAQERTESPAIPRTTDEAKTSTLSPIKDSKKVRKKNRQHQASFEDEWSWQEVAPWEQRDNLDAWSSPAYVSFSLSRAPSSADRQNTHGAAISAAARHNVGLGHANNARPSQANGNTCVHERKDAQRHRSPASAQETEPSHARVHGFLARPCSSQQPARTPIVDTGRRPRSSGGFPSQLYAGANYFDGKNVYRRTRSRRGGAYNDMATCRSNYDEVSSRFLDTQTINAEWTRASSSGTSVWDCGFLRVMPMSKAAHMRPEGAGAGLTA